MVKVIDNKLLSAEIKLLNNESVIGQEYVGPQMMPDGSDYLDVTYITTVRIYRDGRPTQMLQSFSKVKNNNYVKQNKPKRTVTTVNEGEVEL